MTRHAKAPTAGSTMHRAKGLGRFFRGADATRGASPCVKGSGARSKAPLALFAALALVGLIALTASGALAATSTEYVRSFGPDGTESSDFERVSSVALDQQTGSVYVLDGISGVLRKFDADGQPLAWGGSAPNISGNEISGLASSDEPFDDKQVAVDSTSHVVYVTEEHSVRAFHEDGEAAEFTTGPGEHTSEIPGLGELVGVAVDANGAIYAADFTGTVSVFASSGEHLTSFAAGTSLTTNLALAPDGAVYVVSYQSSSNGGGVYKFIPSEFPVTATTTYTAGSTLASDSFITIIGVGVDPLSGDIYVIENFGSASWISKYDSSGTFIRSFGKPGEDGEIAGAGQGVAVVGGGKKRQFYVGYYGFSTDISKVEIFGEDITEGPPSIESTSAADVSADSAELRAEINPNTLETTYHFEYGLGDCAVSACTSVPVGGATIAAGHKPVSVSQMIAGLQAGTVYHYRVIAQNSLGPPSEGPDHTFTTQLSGLGFELADERAWEMVSPPNKFGALLRSSFEGHIQAAEDGNALTYISANSIEAEPEGNRIVEPSTALARRSGAGSWRSKDITTPNKQVTGVPLGAQSEYKLFSPDLSSAIVESRSSALLSPQASERTPYLRENTEPATYTPLVTGKEGFANVPPGTKFGGPIDLILSSVSLAGATPDLSHLALSSDVPLVVGASGFGLYEWTAGQLQPVSVLPAGEGGAIVESWFGSGQHAVRHAISADGSRVFWTAEVALGGHLYLRDTEAGETLRLDVVQSGAGAGAVEPIFQGASADGSVVFFTDTQQLTAGASTSGADLYRCEIPLGSPTLECATLTDISAPTVGPGESAAVQGVVSAQSDDATKLYFVADGVLDSTPNQEGDSAVSGQPNLYLRQEGGGTRFIATLSEGDVLDWGGEGGGFQVELTAASSPGGHYLSFMSERSLTGYDNRDAASGEPVEEVFRYDAVLDRLDCVSCNPSGGVPEGQFGTQKRLLVDPLDRPGRWLAATLPDATTATVASFYRPRAVLDNGRVFFNAFDSLVPADSNGQWDVYQYEPIGLGDCSASSAGAAIVRSAGGCVSLLSSGTAEEEAGFLDASATGSDVFFLTPARLSVTDEDSELDVYDARVDGVPATLTPNTECLGEACQPAVIAPNDPTPSSSSFKGQGNVKPDTRKRCAKDKRAVRRGGKARCVARKHVRHKRHDRAGQGRRAGR